MNVRSLPNSSLVVTELAYGCMRLPGTWNPAEIDADRRKRAFDALAAAYDSGFTLFDHADIYCRGECETLHGAFLKENPSLRNQTTIATKCGIRFKDDPPGTVGRYDFSRDWIISSCEASLRRLGVDKIDVYQLHRPDLLMHPDEVAEALEYLLVNGKISAIGVSNFLPSTIDALRGSLIQRLAVHQIEVSLWKLDPFFDGTLDQCLADGMTPLSWGPLGGGRIEGSDALNAALTKIARQYNSTPAVVALAWLMRHPSGIIPIVGSATPARIRETATSGEIQLTREEWYELLVAARGAPMP